MKKLAALILLLSFFGQTFSQGLFYIDYAIDRAAYEKKCINKFRPKMNCNGKCQLMKKIEEQERKERQEAPQMKLAAKAEVSSSRSSYLLDVPVLKENTRIIFLTTNTGAPIDQPSSLFHPPNA